MHCLRCNGENVLNRIVVDHLRNEELGALCVDCERELFGQVLEDDRWHQDNGCAFCDSRSKFTLPEVDLVVEQEDGSCYTEYEVEETTVSLCHQHLSIIVPDERESRRLLTV